MMQPELAPTGEAQQMKFGAKDVIILVKFRAKLCSQCGKHDCASLVFAEQAAFEMPLDALDSEVLGAQDQSQNNRLNPSMGQEPCTPTHLRHDAGLNVFGAGKSCHT
jgi:hypothetical protein